MVLVRKDWKFKMMPHQLRVVDEKKDLDDKIEKLMLFIRTPTFEAVDSDEQSRLRIQLSTMIAYGTVLGERIAHFA